MDRTLYGQHSKDGKFEYDVSAEIRLAESLQELGNEITLVSDRAVKSKIKDRLVVPLNQDIFYQDMDKMMSSQYDIVFASSVSGAECANFIAKKQGIPFRETFKADVQGI
ncbi:hypothetical protein LCGC14_2782860, partial [marine sediment metagenome]